MEKSNIHVIVAPSSWSNDVLQYRRHRLAQYLKKKPCTKKIIWLTIDSLRTKIYGITVSSTQIGIEQWQVPDVKSLVKFNNSLQYRVCSYMLKQYDPSVRYYLWYTYPAFASLAKLNIWEKVIYDCSDYWTEAEQASNPILNKWKRGMISRSEKYIVKHADLCFASSMFLHKYLNDLNAAKLLTIENGVDFQHYSQSKFKFGTNRNEKPTLGFIGGLKPWKIDFSLLLSLSKARKDWNLVIIGPYYGERTRYFNELIREPNVSLHEEVSYSEVPDVIRTFDVGLLPYLNNQYNQGVFPLKLFEYLACGIPVVGCGLPSTVHYQSAGIYEHVESHNDFFIAACDKALKMADHNQNKRVAMAQTADWNTKFDRIWTVVNS